MSYCKACQINLDLDHIGVWCNNCCTQKIIKIIDSRGLWKPDHSVHTIIADKVKHLPKNKLGKAILGLNPAVSVRECIQEVNRINGEGK